MVAPIWVQALWPILVFFGGALWFGGKHKGTSEAMREQLVDLDRELRSQADGLRYSSERLDRLDLRLTATETNVTNQGRILDRIEAKLDRLIEARV